MLVKNSNTSVIQYIGVNKNTGKNPQRIARKTSSQSSDGQTRLKQQARPAVNNRTKHRYAGLLTCQECGNVFSPMIRYWNGSRRVEYVCRGYQRNGKGYCSSHRIHEEVLDKAVWDHAKKLREQYAAELKKVTQLQKQWALRKPVLDAHCLT